MGTWGTNIKDNDTTADIYADFFENYNNGENPNEITKNLVAKNKYLIENPDDKNNFWFAIALAQWETKSLDEDIFLKVENIIKSENDLKVWEDLDASDKDIKKRKLVLEKFLEKIKTAKKIAKKIIKENIFEPIFQTGDCLTYKFENGNFGGTIILATDNNLGYNLVVATKINQLTKPTKEDFIKAEILIKNFANWKNETEILWINPTLYLKKYSDIYELCDRIKIYKNYDTKSEIYKTYTADWSHAKLAYELQIEYEKTNLSPTKKLKVTNVIGKKWWPF